MSKRRKRPATLLSLPVSQKLKDRISRASASNGEAMNEYVARILAREFGDLSLATIPRDRPGPAPRAS